MSTLNLKVNPNFSLDVTVRESDEYTRAVFLKFEHRISNDETRDVSQMFMTPTQLELIGKFFIRQADEIRTMHSHREQT